MFERSFIGFNSSLPIFFNVLIFKRHQYLQPPTLIIKTKIMIGVDSKYHTFKQMFSRSNPDYAWEVMNLEMQVEQGQVQEVSDLVRLIELYMTGVEVLQNANDIRYIYFYNKMNSLIVKKSVMSKLHQFNTGLTTRQQTLQYINQKQLEEKKSEYQLKLSLQKESYTLQSIKEFLQKEEKETIKRQARINNNVMAQQENLQKRISSRKLRSSSKNKPQSVENIEKESEQKVVYRQVSQYSSINRSRQKKGRAKPANDD